MERMRCSAAEHVCQRGCGRPVTGGDGGDVLPSGFESLLTVLQPQGSPLCRCCWPFRLPLQPDRGSSICRRSSVLGEGVRRFIGDSGLFDLIALVGKPIIRRIRPHRGAHSMIGDQGGDTHEQCHAPNSIARRLSHVHRHSSPLGNPYPNARCSRYGSNGQPLAAGRDEYAHGWIRLGGERDQHTHARIRLGCDCAQHTHTRIRLGSDCGDPAQFALG